MQGYDYGLASSRPSKLKNSQVRPQSQQRSSSLTHNDSLRKQLSIKPLVTRKSMQGSTMGEYYAEQVQRRPFREFCAANRPNSKVVRQQAQNLEKIRKLFIQKLQRWMIELREEIHRQSAQIFNLERIIQKQNQEIENRNSVVRALIARLHGQGRKERDWEMGQKRVDDLQAKMRILVEQMEEERMENAEKIEQLGVGVIKYFGRELWKLKSSVMQFLKEKEKTLQQVDGQVTCLCNDINPKLKAIEKKLEKLHIGLRGIADQTCKDSTSQSTQRGSLFSSTQPEQSFFFYPDQSTLRTIEQLVLQRQELPIRVFTDSSGRLKYWQSRTFIFDRKGNFSLPSSAQLCSMQQLGWIKVIASD